MEMNGKERSGEENEKYFNADMFGNELRKFMFGMLKIR